MKKMNNSFALIFLMLGLSLVNGQTFLTNGLVSFYPFNGNAKDAIGNNDGTVIGATLAADMFSGENRAYEFNGTNAWILCTDTNFPDANAPRTISLWIKFRSYGVPTPTSPVFVCYGSGKR